MGDACKQCAYLNSNVYDDQSIFQSTVWDPIWGDIFNLDTGQKLTHGGTGINCRCTMEIRVQFDWSQVRGLQDLSYELSSFTRYGREITVWRSLETGRFVSGMEVGSVF